MRNMKLSVGYVTVLKYLTTACACLVYVAEGVVFTVPEPTLLQIRDVAGTSIAGISLVFSVRSVGGLVGSLMTGFLFKNWRRDVLLGIVTIIMSLALGVVPWCTNLPIMLCAFFVQGFGIGYLETNANVLVKDIWLDDSAPALQALYLFFLVGSFLSPLMGVPFLSEKRIGPAPFMPRACVLLGENVISTQDLTLAGWCDDLNDDRENEETDAMDLNSLKKFYVLVSSVCIIFGVFMIIFGVLCEKYVLQGCHTNGDENVPDKQQNRLVTVVVLVLITVCGGLFIGAELNYAGFLATFVIIQLKGTYAQGIYITSMYWGVYTVAAAVGVVLAKYIRAAKMMLVCSVTMTIGLIVLVSGAQVPAVLWVGTAIFGLGCSSTYGGIFVLADEYVTLTSAVSAIVVSGTTVGEFLVPLISGQIFEMEPMSLMYLTFTCILVSDVGFIVMEIIVLTKGSKRIHKDIETENKFSEPEVIPLLTETETPNQDIEQSSLVE